MTTCLTEEQLEQLARGSLAEADARRAEAHLKACPACRAALDACRENLAYLDEVAGDLLAIGDRGETRTRDDPPEPRQPALAIEGYQIVRELHRGGQGVVYEALQRSTKRKVAVKVLLAGAHASKVARRRFEREIDLVAQLRHPNIITVFDSGTTSDGNLYCIMD
ncbi:MAG: protein kinase [Planctomycetes bacterium]|nr:protein kinase [Planctomycetota bacterium]